MQANEFRIGVTVKDNDPLGWHFPVTKENFKDLRNLNAVEITEELLGQYGLDRGKKVVLNDEFYIYYHFPTKKLIFTCDRFFDKAQYEIECPYIHQLQNVYFGLTGKELQRSKEMAATS